MTTHESAHEAAREDSRDDGLDADGLDAAPRPADDRETFARRASSFGGVAAAYDEHRPDYPEAGLRWALEPALAAPGRVPDAPLHVLDLGAGTGKLSAGLLALGHRVTAVEPDPQMRAALTAGLPAVTALAGGAEEIPLPDGSVDAVVVGQAFHWFDQSRALPEIARVLRPGGSLAALWNTDDDRVEWIAGLGKVAASRVSFIDWSPQRGIQQHPAYTTVERADFPHLQPRTVESLIATVATHSHVLILDPADRADLLGQVRDYLLSRPETARGTFDLRLVTRVQRCVRLP
ncbi:class I SAM-dependent methyltransferase [Actinacidiphila acididurans]|uniref:Class I SAM-dependent methyltransferase n=1 Tax=Actinacidiphila acididurans TaxID=2784346 RepID=A0ABS2TQN6_9ACTN|nr:class I SAM-dependent methyltransferase [Actinacidiphila acididurans]MBM9505644.1 class I SAM-dependent methyltransferase [Actinacidiphila acididurans]